MTSKKKETLLKGSFIINALLILITSIDIFSTQHWTWGVISVIGALINLAGIKKTVRVLPYFNLSTYLINSFLGVFNMVYFIQKGASYIQWLWMTVAIFYFLLSIYDLVKRIKNIKYKSPLNESIN